MVALAWDKIGERTYQGGVDRGVLYLNDGSVAPWNGLIAVEESPNSELKSFYLDGVKYLDNLTPGDFQGKLRAFTYPDIFDLVNGVAAFAPGLLLHDQPAKTFSLSYRTKIGNDLDGTDHGYKIHILYNITANPDSQSFETANESGLSPSEFSWNLSGVPEKLFGYKPTVHISIDSTKTSPEILEIIEEILYGTDTINPSLLSIEGVAEFFGYLGALIIIDHGDGSWSAIDESDTYITMLDSTTFKIENADATFINATTYTISSTNTHE